MSFSPLHSEASHTGDLEEALILFADSSVSPINPETRKLIPFHIMTKNLGIPFIIYQLPEMGQICLLVSCENKCKHLSFFLQKLLSIYSVCVGACVGLWACTHTCSGSRLSHVMAHMWGRRTTLGVSSCLCCCWGHQVSRPVNLNTFCLHFRWPRWPRRRAGMTDACQCVSISPKFWGWSQVIRLEQEVLLSAEPSPWPKGLKSFLFFS